MSEIYKPLVVSVLGTDSEEVASRVKEYEAKGWKLVVRQTIFISRVAVYNVVMFK